MMASQTSMTAAPDAPWRVLITGGAGFIGSHLAEALLSRGHHVTILDDLSTGRFENIEHLQESQVARSSPSRFRLAIESVANDLVLDRLASECNVIFHLAAAVGVKLIVERPVHTIETNVMGTEAVLKAALRYRAKVVVASTSEVYGKGARTPFREDDDVLLGATTRSRWAYAASKMVDEFLALAYHREKGLPVVICRLFNTVGPRQTGRYGMVIPRFVQQALAAEPVTVYGDGQQSRCFLHVNDCVDGLIRLAQSPEAVSQVFNLGSTEETSILNLAREVIRLTNHLRGRGSSQEPFDDRIQFIPYDKAYAEGFEDMVRRVPDISKIKLSVGWEPRYDLRSILKDVISSMM